MGRDYESVGDGGLDRFDVAMGRLAGDNTKHCNQTLYDCAMQDVAPENAGKLLGITNTCGTAVGILGNILTGNIAASQGGYSAVFALIGACYISSFAVWHFFVNGHNIVLSSAEA